MAQKSTAQKGTLESQVAARLKGLREQRGLTQEQVCAGASVSRRGLCKWEAGQGLPTGRMIAKLADFYGLEPASLLR